MDINVLALFIDFIKYATYTNEHAYEQTRTYFVKAPMEPKKNNKQTTTHYGFHFHRDSLRFY